MEKKKSYYILGGGLICRFLRAENHVVALPSALGEDTAMREDSVADWFPFRGNQALPAIHRSKEEDVGDSFSVNKKPSHPAEYLTSDKFD